MKKTRSPTFTIKSSWEPGVINADSGLVSVIVPSSLEETSEEEEEELTELQKTLLMDVEAEEVLPDEARGVEPPSKDEIEKKSLIQQALKNESKKETINDAHASLKKRKDFYAKSDKEESKFLKAEKKKKSKEEKA